MEPRSLERGEHELRLGDDEAAVASMEPRSLERGEIAFVDSS